jgi:hypothetical protein
LKTFSISVAEDRARPVHVRPDGDVSAYDGRRNFRFECDIAGAETDWQILARIVPHVAAAEARADAIERLADRCRTGWLPVAGDIDPDVRQRTLRAASFGVDLMRFPDDPDLATCTRADVLMGRDHVGRAEVTGEII